MFNLSGKNALVTGASGGIGGAIAKALAKQGAKIVLSGTKEEALVALASEIGDQAVILPCDLGNAEATDSLFGQAESKLGQIDILVNNAGLTRDTLAVRMKDEDWQRVLDVNLTAAFRLSRAALKSMMKRRSGRIIGITSVVGHIGNAGQANYCAAKAGMIGMTKAMAQEVAARGITVNCVAPGFIATAMTAALPESHMQKLLAAIPAGRVGLGDDVAAAVIFLASNEASYITGQTLHVNGGMAMI